MKQQSESSLNSKSIAAPASVASASVFSAFDEQIATHAANSHTRQIGNTRQAPRLQARLIGESIYFIYTAKSERIGL